MRIQALWLGLLLALTGGNAFSQTSTINPALPAAGLPYSSSVIRGQFDAAYNDINGLFSDLNCQPASSSPGSPHRGSCWLDTSAAALWIYKIYDDTTTTWVPIFTIDSANAQASTAQAVPNTTSLTIAPIAAYPQGVWRLDYATGHGSTPLLYKPNNSACSLNGGNGDNGSQIKSGDSKCWLAQWPNGVIDVTEFGADATGVGDSAPAVRAAFALASDQLPKHYIFPAGTYTIKSLVASPYPLVTGSQGLTMYCASATPCKNVVIDGYGAIITANAASANSNWFGFDYINGFSFRGFTFQATPGSWPGGSAPSAMFAAHLNEFTFEDIYLAGNWGGSTKSPGFIGADWLTNGNFNRIQMPQQGLCFDLAFLRRVTFTNISAQGANDSTSGGSRTGCLNIETDWNFTSNYPAAVSFTTTEHVTIDTTASITGFAAGIFLRAGSFYTIGAHSYANTGANSVLPDGNGMGVFLYNDTSVCCNSSIDPVHDVIITGGTFDLNGTSVTGAGVFIDASAATAAEGISNINITGNIFNNNTNTAVSATGPHLSGLVIGPNITTGTNQTTRYNTGALAVLADGTPSTQYVAACAGYDPNIAVTQYCIGGFSTNTETATKTPTLDSGLFKNLSVFANASPGAGHTYTFTLRINGADGTVTCQIANAATVCSDVTHADVIVSGQSWDLKMVADGATANLTNVTWGVKKLAP